MENEIIFDREKLTYIPKNQNFICMFSGGKDSALAYSMVKDYSTPTTIIHCLNKENNDSINHFQDKSVIEKQAEVMGIALCYHHNHWTKWPQLIRIYDRLKKEGVRVVVFGDSCRADNVQLQITLCESTGLTPCFPLWDRSYDDLILEIEKRKIKSVITSLYDDRINGNWLGKIFDRNAYNAFKEAEINPFGEYGEYHTTLIDSDFFKSAIAYKIKYLNRNNVKILL